jgi:hypothetical protein
VTTAAKRDDLQKSEQSHDCAELLAIKANRYVTEDVKYPTSENEGLGAAFTVEFAVP